MVYLGLQDDDEYGYDAPYDPRHDDAYGQGPGGGGQGQGGPVGGGPVGGGPDQGYGPDDPYATPGMSDGPHSGGVRTIGGAEPDARSVSVRNQPGGVRMGQPTVRALPRDEQPSGVSINRPGVARAVSTATGKVHVVEPRGFNDAQQVGDRVKANQPVILNLQGSTKELRRRLIDFASGLAYAVDGSMTRVADAVFLISPVNVEISDVEKERLEAKGLYRRD
jgi:cell division inhibitor SepF